MCGRVLLHQKNEVLGLPTAPGYVWCLFRNCQEMTGDLTKRMKKESLEQRIRKPIHAKVSNKLHLFICPSPWLYSGPFFGAFCSRGEASLGGHGPLGPLPGWLGIRRRNLVAIRRCFDSARLVVQFSFLRAWIHAEVVRLPPLGLTFPGSSFLGLYQAT